MLPLVGPKFGMNQLSHSNKEIYTIRPRNGTQGPRKEPISRRQPPQTSDTKHQGWNARGRTTRGRTTHWQEPEAGTRGRTTSGRNNKAKRLEQRHQDQKQQTATDSKQQITIFSRSCKRNLLTATSFLCSPKNFFLEYFTK